MHGPKSSVHVKSGAHAPPHEGHHEDMHSIYVREHPISSLVSHQQTGSLWPVSPSRKL
jgi:hypothetical protein